MAQDPHFLNLSIRPNNPEPWRWTHDWDMHRHTYRGSVTLHMMRAHPGPLLGQIPITMYTVLTLDLSTGEPFVRPSPPPPGYPPIEPDLMDIDIPKDYVFRDPSADSDDESKHTSSLLPPNFLQPLGEIIYISSDSSSIDSEDAESDQWTNESIGEEELMSDLDNEEVDSEMEDSEEEDSEEDSEEDLMED